jgi:hypothetical protein
MTERGEQGERDSIDNSASIIWRNPKIERYLGSDNEHSNSVAKIYDGSILTIPAEGTYNLQKPIYVY